MHTDGSISVAIVFHCFCINFNTRKSFKNELDEGINQTRSMLKINKILQHEGLEDWMWFITIDKLDKPV